MIAVVSFWLTCALLSHCLMFAFWQEKFPEAADVDYRSDLRSTILISGLLGPMALTTSILFIWAETEGNLSRYGFRLF